MLDVLESGCANGCVIGNDLASGCAIWSDLASGCVIGSDLASDPCDVVTWHER
jgi:hypothetical protein